MNLQLSYNASEDRFPLPQRIRAFYGPFGFPEGPAGRPHTTSNFAMGLDGRASFREIAGHTGGREISRSREDRWLMDFLRVHHDAVLMGAATVREEPGTDPAGWDYGIDDPELIAYRRSALGMGTPRAIVLTAASEIDVALKVFHSPRVEPWILTTAEGAEKLKPRLAAAEPASAVKVLAIGNGARVDLARAMRVLRSDHGIRTLLCEGGPTVYGELLRQRLIDEDFRTVALQVPGRSSDPRIERPAAYGGVSFTPQTAPWFRLISLHYALPYHVFLRLRYEGPRRF